MAEVKSRIEIQPHFPYPGYSKVLSLHVASIQRMLEKMLPPDLLDKEAEEVADWFKEHLPLVKWSAQIQPPDALSIYFLCAPPQHIRGENLFLDLLKKWLIPEKEIQILSVQNMYFYLKGVGSQYFFLVKAKVLVEDGRDYLIIQNNLPLLAKELSLSVSSSRYARYVLDAKALSYDQKATLIHEELRKVGKKYPTFFDNEIFTEMSRFFALSTVEFLKFRPARQITRLIISHYQMRKQLLRALAIFPEKRHLSFRLMHTRLSFPFGSKPALGVAIAVALLDKYENFDEAHILIAVQKYIPEAQIVKDSYYSVKGMQSPIASIYLELEKKDGSPFSAQHVALLNRELEDELKKRVEKLIPSVFMTRNEEEVMRNILLLSQELKYLSDLPQVMISFDKQTANDLIFTVILVRILKNHDQPLKNCFQNLTESFRFIADRTQNVGYLRKKNPKEANVFHLSIPKDLSILRADSSVNFYLARQKIVDILNRSIGEIRDYNGGMILKQGELFAQFKHVFREVAEKNHELLENFFFALSPIEAQATLPTSQLETLFELFLEASQANLVKKESYFLKVKQQNGVVFSAIATREQSIEECLVKELSQLDNFSKVLIKTQVNFHGLLIYGYLYETADEYQQQEFSNAFETAINKWVSKIRNQQELHLSFLDLPPSLDPRLGGDDLSSTLVKMLFDGLTRISPDNKPDLSIAKSIDISPDQKRYVFKLRHCLWSDDSRVVAYDFEYAWKKILSPNFYTPFAFFFYCIKNARLAKEGKIGLDQVEVRAIDDSTLVVELEYPTPEFLKFTSHSLYSPINHEVDRIHPNWAQTSEEIYVCNGPFKLKKIHARGGYELVKNPKYWDKESVKLDRIVISKDNSVVANEMYKNDEIDFIGRPMRPWESYFSRGSNEIIHGSPLGVYWCTFNVQRFPFHHLKMRQAINYAINRVELVKMLPQGSLPAITPLPLPHTQNFDSSLIQGNRELALQLFEEALVELGLKRQDFPVITIIHGGKIRETVAELIKIQLQSVLGIPCRIEEYEFHQLFTKMTKGEYQLGTISWSSWIDDPIYTLNTLKYRNNEVNFTKWEHPQFQKLLDFAQSETDPKQRLLYLQEAEKLLIKESPIIPIFYEVYHYVHKDYLKGALCSGNVDFKWAAIVKDVVPL